MRVLISLVSLVALSLPGVALAQKKPKTPPKPGTVFRLSDKAPGYVTADIEFRDPTDAHWPNFFYGKPASAGTFTFDPKRPQASFVLDMPKMAQPNGEQTRRVLGELSAPGKPPAVKLAVKSLGELTKETTTGIDAKGKKFTRTTEVAPVEAVLDVGGKTVPVKGTASFRWGYEKNAETPNQAFIDLTFTLEPAKLGLSKVAGAVECRAAVTAFEKPPEGKKK